MLVESHQDYAMTPERSSRMPGDSSDTAALMNALAAAPDWQAFVDALRLPLARRLPATRLDIYAIEADDGIAQLRFSSEDTSASPPVTIAAATDSQIRGLL